MTSYQPSLLTVRELEPEYLVEVTQSPWDNVYWFARMLIASDKYGGVGNDRKTMVEITSAIRTVRDSLRKESEEIVVSVLTDTIRNILMKRWEGTRKQAAVTALCDDLSRKLLSLKDFQVLAFTCECVLIPILDSLSMIPSSDQAFAESIVKAMLNSRGEAALPTIINLWDDIGSYGSMAAERTQIVQKFGLLRDHVRALGVTAFEENLILTAFCQEFERRVAQKRKGRAGRGVESVTSLILEHFGFTRVSEGPEHFTTGLEIDRWIKCKDGWYIGISCKRTLRERWKQAYTTDLDLLNRHKIKALWHVITFDRDLSDDKIAEMGSYRARLYLADESPRYLSAARHPGMQDYVRPISRFVSDLTAEVG
ncbi:MAG: hypothetical protein N2508_13700 [Anaerolineae bacterium]|nr:hypothetical protein [Anaerolineae bacterium]